jgi:F-type H+-transporting ATPase subunit delta
MTSRAIATRYARALFEVAVAERTDLRRIELELSEFAKLMAADAQLARVLTSPAIPTARKRALVERLVDSAGPLLPQVSKLLLLLAERDRLGMLGVVLDAYRNRLMDYYQVVRAEVVTAAPLSGDRLAALEQGLGRATGRKVQLESRVDPEIIGGAVARIGSTVYDGSVTMQLRKMREALTGAE